MESSEQHNVKQVIVIRRDLKMRRGKEIAQGAHASMAWLCDRLFPGARRVGAFGAHEVPTLTGTFSDDEMTWLTGNFRKITCQVSSEEEILALKEHADRRMIPAFVITDSGLTEFGGVPTVTAIGIGPDYDQNIDVVTGHLQLY